MRVKEYIGKEIFKKYGIEIPKSFLVTKDTNLESLKFDFEELVLKAQVLFGNRMKNNLIIFSNKQNFFKDINTLFSKGIKEILVEERIYFEKEFYLAVFLDTYERKLKVLFSEKGGIDVSEASELNFNNANEKIKEIAKKLLKIAIDYDAELVEINPLVLSKNSYIALDSKIIIDNNSLYKHKDIKIEIENEIERIAFENGISFVDLNGSIGIVGVGAGLTMATMDFFTDVAFFMDIGGGALAEKIKVALKIIKMRKPKKVIFNIFGGITRCDEVAKAIVEEKLNIPIFIRISGTNEEIAKKILKENGIEVFDSLEEIIRTYL
ncbi:MAG: ATP-grasp domain-containing protein [Candidatus Aenigmarchaeota archaeon]|nr:hypothetical protein [Candidatus Aenigmarchaeota archaeon]MDW8149744.1 ATP-grasp domain-containing protein [Candidatus Aenigmarchaeota archaeon]